MHKPARTYPKPLGDMIDRCLGEVFARQGFASSQLVTHWPDIVGDEIAALAEPVKLQWPRAIHADAPEPALARVLLLDQFTRNAFRDTPRAFAGDARALKAAQAMVAARQDAALAPLQRQFVYLPFEHAESLPMQDEAMRLFGALAAEQPQFADLLEWARRHRDIIARFGRFPHRNALLGRASTPDEEAFLLLPGSRF